MLRTISCLASRAEGASSSRPLAMLLCNRYKSDTTQATKKTSSSDPDGVKKKIYNDHSGGPWKTTGPLTPNQLRIERLRKSKTQLFVSKLPPKFDDAQLKELYAEYGAKKARIIRRPSGVSRGMGVVDFKSAEMQQKALKEVKAIGDRTLFSRVAKENW